MAWNNPKDEEQGARRSGAGGGGGWRGFRLRLRGQGLALSGLGIALLLLLIASTCYYQVDDAGRGVVQRFGRLQRVDAPGGHWHWPWPVESTTVVNVARAIELPLNSELLTSDGNLLEVNLNLQYLQADPVKALFRVQSLDAVLRDAGHAALRDAIARRTMASLLTGAREPALDEGLRQAIQRRLDVFDCGVQMRSAAVAEIRVPASVVAAREDIDKARQDADKLASDARAYAATLVPQAEAEAQRIVQQAGDDKRERVAKAEADAARLAPVLAEYAVAPAATRNRLYEDTMADIYARSRKVYVDLKPGNGNVVYLQLDKLLQPSNAVAAGSAATGTPGVSIESVPEGGTHSAAATGPAGAAPAIGPAGAPPANAAPVAAPKPDPRLADESRGRERGVR